MNKYRCQKCTDTGHTLTPYSEEIYCSCPIGKAFCMCWDTFGTPEDKEKIIEYMRLFLVRDPEPKVNPTPPLVCTGTGTIPTDYSPMAYSIPCTGVCGICGQRVGLISVGAYGSCPVVVTHSYKILTPKSTCLCSQRDGTRAPIFVHHAEDHCGVGTYIGETFTCAVCFIPIDPTTKLPQSSLPQAGSR